MIKRRSHKLFNRLLNIDMEDPKSKRVIAFRGEEALTKGQIASMRTILSHIRYGTGGPSWAHGIETTTTMGEFLPNSNKREFFIMRVG